MSNNIITKTLSGSSGTFDITFPKPVNVTIGGTFGGGTVTHTMRGSSVPIRTGSTSDDSYRCVVQESTFTLSGATGADITITLEPTHGT